MEPMCYIGLDVHKRIISYFVRDSSGKMYAEGSIPATTVRALSGDGPAFSLFFLPQGQRVSLSVSRSVQKGIASKRIH
jgi:hypothetical protein